MASRQSNDVSLCLIYMKVGSYVYGLLESLFVIVMQLSECNAELTIVTCLYIVMVVD